MIGWIIKKIGEDVYLQEKYDESDTWWIWGKFPYFYESEEEVIKFSGIWQKDAPNEVKRADIFITP